MAEPNPHPALGVNNSMASTLLPLTADTYRVHELHATELVWSETNCYVDVWIEVLSALGLDPLVAAAFTVATDFEGDQWTFFKYPPEDLRRAYGIDVHEMNPWRSVIDHVEEQLAMGRLLTVEADSWYLPDTAGVSYRLDHVKSTIVANDVDREHRRLGYFHNAGYYELSGEDFDGVFRLTGEWPEAVLPPYVEIVRLEGLHRLSEAHASALALDLLCEYSLRRPMGNPVDRMGARILADLPLLRAGTAEDFHVYAFGTCRQCGASAQTAAAFCRWLGHRHVSNPGTLAAAAQAWQLLAEQSKSLQFSLARAARGRDIEIAPLLASMAATWQKAQDLTAAVSALR